MRTSHREARTFDLRDPLPTGVTVLEASAGTGKTYAIAGLAARYVAEGMPLDRLLMVTFTRMATGELRERVRERLVSVEHGLTRSLAGVEPTQRRPGRRAAGGRRPSEEVRLRRDRLARALADFDAATIATTHGFCEQVLGGLGIAADLEPGITFVDDLSELVADVDRRPLRAPLPRVAAGPPPFGRAEAAEIARVGGGKPDRPDRRRPRRGAGDAPAPRDRRPRGARASQAT